MTGVQTCALPISRTIGSDEGNGLALIHLNRYALQRVDMIIIEFDTSEFEDLIHGLKPNRLVLAAQIGLDDFFIALYFQRCAFSYFFTKVDHDNAV